MAKTGKRKERPAAKPLKDAVIRMRVSVTQKRAIKYAAERQGLEVSAWLRQLALRAAGVLEKSK